MRKINALILAGGSLKAEQQGEEKNKALVPMNGRPMVSYVVDALYESDSINQISMVGPEQDLRKHLGAKVDYYFEEKDSLFENIRVGLAPFSDDDRVLLVTSDIPLITSRIIEDFIGKCEMCHADLCYPVVKKEDMERKFPGATRTYVKLKEGMFTGGNVIYFSPGALELCEDFTKKAIEYRKKPWKTSKLLGIKFLVMLFLGMLTIPKVEERFSKLLNIKGTAILSPYPELANDVDKPSDFEMIERHMKGLISNCSHV